MSPLQGVFFVSASRDAARLGSEQERAEAAAEEACESERECAGQPAPRRSRTPAIEEH